LFGYPEDIRKAIFTTNAIESPYSVIRKAVQRRKLFPTNDSAKKVVYLATQEASQKWTMPIKNWKSALNRFIIEFKDRYKIIFKYQFYSPLPEHGCQTTPENRQRCFEECKSLKNSFYNRFNYDHRLR
jgi:hypothetical protein